MSNIDEAIAACQAEMYEDAILHLNEAIEENPDVFILHDLRSAFYAKLGKTKAALADAQKVMELQPNSSKGFLMSAHLFKTVGDLHNVIRTYRLAIANGASNNDAIHVLERELSELHALNRHGDVANKQSGESNFGQLPADIFIHIMLYLPHSDVLRCCGVGSKWRKLIFSTAELWRTLHFTDRTRRPRQKVQFWDQRLRGSDRGLTELSISRVNVWNADFTQKFTQLLGQVEMTEGLRDLRFRGWTLERRVNVQAEILLQFACTRGANLRILTADFAGYHFFREDFYAFVILFPHLEELELIGRVLVVSVGHRFQPSALPKGLPKLKRLRLAGVFFEENAECIAVPSLEELFLTKSPICPVGSSSRVIPFLDWTELPNLRTLHLKPPSEVCSDFSPSDLSPDGLHYMPSVETLVVVGHSEFIQESLPGTPSGPRIIQAPLLRTLELGAMDNDMTTRFIVANTPHYVGLEKLVLNGVLFGEACRQLDTIFSYLPRLKSLDVSRSDFPDEGVDALSEHATALAYLDISDCRAVTGTPLMRLVDARGHTNGGGNGLLDLDIRGCTGIAQEAVLWIKERVARVEFESSDSRSDA